MAQQQTQKLSPLRFIRQRGRASGRARLGIEINQSSLPLGVERLISVEITGEFSGGDIGAGNSSELVFAIGGFGD